MLQGDKLKAARRMRKAATSAERDLWHFLRRKGHEGLRFRRQVPLGPYVADFLCYSHRLIVEVDGPFHDPEHDRKRDDWLRSKGFEVLRFPIGLVHNRPHLVLHAISAAASRRPLPPSPFEQNFLPS